MRKQDLSWKSWSYSLSATHGCTTIATTQQHVSYGLNTLATFSSLTRLPVTVAGVATPTYGFTKTFTDNGKNYNI
jgi:hypothetical protein